MSYLDGRVSPLTRPNFPDKKGYVAIVCGQGKGKTTSLIGQAVRASGQRWRTGIFQFLKDENTGEYKSLSRYMPHVDFIAFGPDKKIVYKNNINESDKKMSIDGWNLLKMVAPNYDIVLVDEIFPAIELGFIPQEEVINWIDNKPKYLDIFMSGGTVPVSIRDRADGISKIENVKHWYESGVSARKGIEY